MYIYIIPNIVFDVRPYIIPDITIYLFWQSVPTRLSQQRQISNVQVVCMAYVGTFTYPEGVSMHRNGR